MADDRVDAVEFLAEAPVAEFLAEAPERTESPDFADDFSMVVGLRFEIQNVWEAIAL